jgi:ABC-type antimicrobial peptide transport system permease subunit
LFAVLKKILHSIITFNPKKFAHSVAWLLYVLTVLWIWQTLTFIVLLMSYLTYQILQKILKFRLIPRSFAEPLSKKLTSFYVRITSFSRQEELTINRINLIDIAFRNMLFKKSRAIVTIGGMAIGIAAIVFLVSIGFGLQEVIIRRVARLDELKQTDVTSQPGSREKITDKTISDIKNLPNTDQALPMIASVAKVSVQKSVSDMAVYGVTADYLNQSAVKLIHGKIFDSQDISYYQEPSEEQLLLGDESQPPESDGDLVSFSLEEEQWIRLREEPSTDSKVLGFVTYEQKIQEGERVWGEFYSEAEDEEQVIEDGDESKAPWLKSYFHVWEKVGGEYQQIVDDLGNPVEKEGYIAQIGVSVNELTDSRVLGLKTENEDQQVLLAQADISDESTDSAAIASTDVPVEEGWVEIASESSTTLKEQIKTISLADNAKKEAVVNLAMLQIMGIPEGEAVGKTFEVSFVVLGELLDTNDEKIQSVPTQYTIVGVIPEDKTPFFYVPFIDMRGLGISNYSQLKVVAKEASQLHDLRKQIESVGFTTRSVADTVKQIDQLFATVRIVLSILGLVALSIAALGMFNTLTVSLLERTREVGLMKAMGMKSQEVRELFLTESLVMGFFGGVIGIFLGFLAGKLLGLLLSILSVSKGAGFIDISYLPFGFVAFIFILSLVVGIFTGVYPAIRATKISALDALRYE